MLMTQAVLEHPQASHMRERATEKGPPTGDGPGVGLNPTAPLPLDTCC